MYQNYKEAAFPLTYRRREIACLTAALAIQRSVQVVGLNGMGKSHLLRFLISHPRLLEDHPDLPFDSVCFLYIDCNKLNPVNAFNFYREGYFRLQPQQTFSPLTEAYLLYKRFEWALEGLDSQTFVVLVIDRANYLSEQVGPEFFSQLRNLRDDARGGNLAFIFGGRRPLKKLYALERLFSDTCWVGTLAARDRAEFFARHAARLNFTVDAHGRAMLERLTGAHPGLLKNGLEWLKRQGREALSADEGQVIQALLAYPPLRKHCRAIWESLTQVERHFLRRHDLYPPQAGADLEQLEISGLIVESGAGLRLFSPLLEAYLKGRIWPSEPVEPLQIEIDPATWRVRLRWRGQTRETIITRKLVFDLLGILSANPGQIHSKNDLITALYGAEAAYHIYEDSLFQLVAALRRSLDRPVQQLCPAMSESCIQNVRGVGYRLIVDLPV